MSFYPLEHLPFYCCCCFLRPAEQKNSLSHPRLRRASSVPGMSSGVLLALLTPQAVLGSAVREQCWPQGSVSTNAPQNAAAISVLRSWGAAFDALQGQDVCHMATRAVAQTGVSEAAEDGCWPVQCVQVGQELVVQAFSLTTDTVRPGAAVGSAAAGAADAVKRWVASLAVAPAATGAIPDSLSQQNFPQLTHM